jgi:rsbT antagonist protein RsbS
MSVTDSFIPLMRIGECLFVSVPSELSDSQARFLQESIGQRLAKERAVRGLVMDVSALSIVDSFAAKILGEIANIARSFGAQAVLVGIRPAVAVALIELGIDLKHVETAINLEKALKKLRIRIVSEI